MQKTNLVLLKVIDCNFCTKFLNKKIIGESTAYGRTNLNQNF